MSDPFIALDVLMDAIAQGVEDGVRLWILTVIAVTAITISCAWLYERHTRRNGK